MWFQKNILIATFQIGIQWVFNDLKILKQEYRCNFNLTGSFEQSRCYKMIKCRELISTKNLYLFGFRSRSKQVQSSLLEHRLKELECKILGYKNFSVQSFWWATNSGNIEQTFCSGGYLRESECYSVEK